MFAVKELLQINNEIFCWIQLILSGGGEVGLKIDHFLALTSLL